MKKIIIVIFSVFILSCNDSSIIDPDYSPGKLTIINITILPEHYTELLENKLSDVSVPAEMIINNKFYKVHLSPQGAGSRFYPKFGLKVSSGESMISGLKEFNLSTQVYDKTMMRSTLSSHLYRQLGFPDFYSEVIFLKINNEDKGLFLLAEKIDEEYFRRRNQPVFELVKTVFDAKFTFDNMNNPEATFEKKIPDDNNFSNLSDFIYAVDTANLAANPASLEKYLNVNNYIKYHLMTSVINNTDGLANNFYFYKKKGNSPYEIIPWDFDKSFNLDFRTGIVGDNGIIKKILQSPVYKKYYTTLLKEVADKYFTEDNLFPLIDSCYKVNKTFYNRDPILNKDAETYESRIEQLKKFISSQRRMIKNTIVD